MTEENGMVRVLVGQKRGSEFPGFWAEFEGKEVSSYEDPRIDKTAVYTLYRCTAYSFEAYRVHVRDESNPDAPVYQLLPFLGDWPPGGRRSLETTRRRGTRRTWPGRSRCTLRT